jgi:vitamin B12/bleomycin/antimicrobial peptide transport system ATP-binding/permease protein
MNGARRNMLRAAWNLAKHYWSSEEAKSAWALLVLVIALNLGNVYISVRINQWNNAFYNALQDFNAPEFFRQLGIFCLLAGASVAMSVYAFYFQQMLQIRWRRWLTGRYLARWLADRTYFRMQLHGQATDNPDQRISDDLRLFVEYVMTLALGLLTSVVSVASFMVILWGLSGPAEIPLFGWGSVYIPAYLVWTALIYAGFGTWLTVKIGRPLVPLNFAQQRFEADFRYSLVRLRENAESVALYGGEPTERAVFDGRFANVFANYWQIMVRRKMLNWFTSGYSQVAVIFPVLVVAPRYFSKAIQLGGLMQVIDAFSNVQSSLSFIVNSYADIATWSAVTERLGTFDTRMDDIARSLRAPQAIREIRSGKGLDVKNLALDLPDGAHLLSGVSFEVAPGEALLITGPNGIGKSTLLRAVAGIWPFGRGDIRLGQGRSLFLPQRPYLPLGTLKDALTYPRPAGDEPADRLIGALKSAGLEAFASRLDEAEDWAQRLSLGEQQRLAFARVFLAKPDLLFLDESTSALDEATESDFYQKLRQGTGRPTLVSVGHRDSLKTFHDRTIDLAAFTAKPPAG